MPIIKTIWLIGGTQESKQIAQALLPILTFEQRLVVTVTTANACKLYPTHPQLQIRVGGLTPQAMLALITAEQIVGIVDASHPFATQVSEGAIAAVQHHNVPYLRYERSQCPLAQALPANSTARQARSDQPWVQQFPNLDTLLATEKLLQQRVLLVLGYRLLHRFRDWQAQTQLFARILPSITALNVALEAGFSSDHLIALRPPISYELEKALWQQWQITMVIAKASGPAGGEDIKRRLAAELDIPLLLLERPELNYSRVTHQIDEVVAFCQQCFTRRSHEPN